MYIIKQKIKGKDYYYLRKAVREGKKVKSICVAYLGKTKKEAEKKKKVFEEKMKDLKDKEIKSKVMEEKEIELEKKEISIEEMMMFCKRKGFVYPSAEIYGGMSGFWDFGDLGTELEKNIKDSWWQYHVRQRLDMAGIDGSVITNPKVWEASGHVASFKDVSVQCKKCKKFNKVDKHELDKVVCSFCKGDLNKESAKELQQMLSTQVGPIEDQSLKAYLRPETAQLIFTNFKYVQENARLQLPFGIAQIGKAFRNEIAPRDFLFRCREFEQMEIEYFVDPDEECPYEIGDSEILIYSEDMQKENKEPEKMIIKQAFQKKIIKKKWHAYWLEQEFLWFVGLGANKDKFRIRQHLSEERSHYSSDTWDLQYQFPFGWQELQGVADRSNYDLMQHQKNSGEKMEIVKADGKKLVPHVVCEPSLGVGRAFLVFMFDSFYYDKKRQNNVLRLNPRLSPVKASIFPIIKKPEYENIAKEIFKVISKEFNVDYDKSGSIGRRYSRADEQGTPMCITIDEQTPKDNTVTIRDRDSTKQVRVKIEKIRETVRNLIEGEDILKVGKEVKTRVKESEN